MSSMPVERIFVEKQHRLLTRPLYASWTGPGEGRPFLVLANVAWFYKHKAAALVADCLLSLDVSCPTNLHRLLGPAYSQWELGKPPDAVIEIVTDRLGGEDTWKRDLYNVQGVSYYAIFDPDGYLSDQPLRVMRRFGMAYEPISPELLRGIGLGLTLWEGSFEGHHDTWLRWCDPTGQVIPTGEERANVAEARIRELEEALKRAQGGAPGSP